MTSITTIVDIQDTNPQSENFDTVRSIDVDQEGFIESNRAPDDNNENSIDQPPDDDEMDHVELSLLVNDSADHGIPSEALIEALHPEQQLQLQDLNNENNQNNNVTTTLPDNPFSPPPAVARLSRRTTSQNSSGNTDDHYDDTTTNDVNTIRATKRTCLRRKASKESGLTNVYNELPTSDTVSSPENNEQRISSGPAAPMGCRCTKIRRLCRESSTHLLRTTVSVMNFFARILLYGSVVAMIIGVVWYSRELKLNGTDPHLIAWFSAGAFVLLGFPISMCGIFMHLTNYYQPNVQCYVVRILWMVPIYSIQSWLCLRYIEGAIYIETLRDFYESYVLYSFFQFLVEVLQGEEQLTLMLKDKSPTRGVHMWGLQWCVKPWSMGQPVSRRVSFTPDRRHAAAADAGAMGASALSNGETYTRPIKRVEWTSPFFIKCKFGVLQYVLLKFVSAIFVMGLHYYGLYKEGDFTPKGGYLYICILTNLSQCWALYCLIFFYYALKNELGPIRPVGKFLSVKALVFFTWWQSLGIAILAMMGLIPHYTAFNTEKEWTSEAVAKGMQDWLICIEMFVAAIVHTFVFPHTDYLEPLNLVNRGGRNHLAGAARRVGRRGRFNRRGDDRSACTKNSGGTEPFETLDEETGVVRVSSQDNVAISTVYESDTESAMSGDVPRHQRQGFVRALIDSTLPRDVLDESGRIFKGEFNVEKKSLLHHAVTSDEYDLFAKSSNRRGAKSRKARSNKTSEEVPNSISM